MPQPGRDAASCWCANSSLAYDHAASGDADSTLQLLNRQLGVVRFAALEPVLRSCYCSVQAATAGFPGMPALVTPLQRRTGAASLPMTVYHVQHAAQLAKLGLKCFQSGRFEDALSAFRSFYLILPVIVAASKEEELALRQFADMAREYIEAVLLELARRQEAQPARNLCLAYYMTQCRLQTAHLLLALNSAMVAAFKAENFIDAALFATQILNNSEIGSPKNASLAQKARKVLAKSEKEGRNRVETGYTPDSPFVIECEELVPMKKEAAAVCPYCGAMYRGEKKGKVCCICKLAQVGVDTVGLVCTNSLLLSVSSTSRFHG